MLPLTPEADLPRETAEVVANNTADLTTASTLPKLGHILLIVRENRTLDEIFGDLPGADGDPALARWGLHGWTKAAPDERTIQVTPKRPRAGAAFCNQ